MRGAAGTRHVRVDVHVAFDDLGNQCVAHLDVANQMHEAIDARGHETHGIVVIEHVRVDA